MDTERVGKRKSQPNGDSQASRLADGTPPPLFNRTGRRLKGPDDYAAAHPDDLEAKMVVRKRKLAEGDAHPDSRELETPVRVLFCRFCQSEVTSKSNRISEHLQSVRHNRFKQGIQAGESWNALAAMYGAHSSSKLALQETVAEPVSTVSSSSSSSVPGVRNGVAKKTPPPSTVQNDAKQRRVEQFAFDVLQTCAYLGVSSTAVDKHKAVLLNAFAKYVPNCVPRATKLDLDEACRRWLPEIFVKHVEELRIRLKARLVSLTIDDKDGRSGDYTTTCFDIYASVFDAVADEQRLYLLWSVSVPLAQPVAHCAEMLLDCVECLLRLFDCEPAQVVAVTTSCSAVARRFADLFVRKRPSLLHVPNIRNVLQRSIYRALTCESELEVVFNLVKQTEQCFRHAVGVRQAYLEACVAAGISPENVGVCWNMHGTRWQSWFAAARSVHKSWSFLSAFLENVSSEQLAAGGCTSGEFSTKQFDELKACFTADEHRELIYLLLTAVIDALEPFRDVAQYLDEDVDLPFKVAYLLNTKLKRAAESPLSDRVLCMINVLARTKQERVLRIVNQFRATLASACEQELERSASTNVFAAGGFFERCAVFDPVFKTLAQYSTEQSAQLLASFQPHLAQLAEHCGVSAVGVGQEFCEYVLSHPVQQCVVSLTQFWKSNTRKYPNLSSLALQLAAIPVATPFRKDDLTVSDRPATHFLPSCFASTLAPLLNHTRDSVSVMVRCLEENAAVFVESQKRATVLMNVATVRDASAAVVATSSLLCKLDESTAKLCAANLSASLVLPTQAIKSNADVLNLGKCKQDEQNQKPVTPKRRRMRSPSPSPVCDSPSSSSASNNDYYASDQAELKNELDEKEADETETTNADNESVADA